MRVKYLGEPDERRPFLQRGREFLLLGELMSHGRPYVGLSTLDGKKTFYLRPALIKR